MTACIPARIAARLPSHSSTVRAGRTSDPSRTRIGRSCVRLSCPITETDPITTQQSTVTRIAEPYPQLTPAPPHR